MAPYGIGVCRQVKPDHRIIREEVWKDRFKTIFVGIETRPQKSSGF